MIKCLIMNNKVRNIKVVIQELVEDRSCLPNSTELRSEMRRGKGDKSLGMERRQEKETNGTTAIRGGADADLVLSVSSQISILQWPKVDREQRSTWCTAAWPMLLSVGLWELDWKTQVLKTKDLGYKVHACLTPKMGQYGISTETSKDKTWSNLEVVCCSIGTLPITSPKLPNYNASF